jgi:TetR/AcrR family transcriptional repressor of nem operon
VPRPKEFDRTSTLDRAMDLFWRRGYEATSLSDLERHLGIGRQSIYDTFGTKIELYRQALDRYSAVPVSYLLSRLDAGGARAIRGFFERLIDYQARPSPPACFMVNSAIELAPRDPQIRSQVHEHLRRLEAGFHAAFTRAQAQGHVAAMGLDDPRAAARLLTCATLGLLVAAKAGMPVDILRRTADAALSAVGIPKADYY